MSSWTAASSDCSRPVNNYVHVKTADLYRPNARLTPERQGYQVLTPFGKPGYSPIFDKRYVHIKKALRTAIDDIYDDEDKTDKAGVVRDLLKGRLLNNTWPIPTRLELFAKTFGVTLHEGDTEVVKRLGRIRARWFTQEATARMAWGAKLRN